MGLFKRIGDNAKFGYHRARITAALEQMQKHQFDRHPFVYDTWQKKAEDSWQKLSEIQLRKTKKKD